MLDSPDFGNYDKVVLDHIIQSNFSYEQRQTVRFLLNAVYNTNANKDNLDTAIEGPSKRICD